MGQALRIVGLIVIAFAVVGCVGGAYIDSIILGSVAPQGQLANETKTGLVIRALISGGIFVVGAVLFAVGTSRQGGHGSAKKGKKKLVTCPGCSERYSKGRLRCPSCGVPNEQQ